MGGPHQSRFGNAVTQPHSHTTTLQLATVPLTRTYTWWVQKEALPNSLAFAAAQRTTMLDNGEVAPYVLEVLDDMGLVQTTPKGDRGRPVSAQHNIMQAACWVGSR